MQEETTKQIPLVPKEKHSTPNHIQLMKYQPQSFAGIRPDMNFVFDLGDGPVVGFKGDQGLGKTSLINCLITLLGGDEAANSMNVALSPDGKRSKNKSASITFKDIRNEHVTYEARVTKTSYSVKKIELTDGATRPVTSTVDSPKSFMRDMFGPIGISPMILKEQKGKEQIEWIRSLYRFSADELKLEADIKDKLKTATTSRTQVNKDVKRLHTELVNTGYYKWEEENKYFIVSPKREEDKKNIEENLLAEDDLKKEFDAARQQVRDRDQGETLLASLNENRASLAVSIEELRKKLADAEAQYKHLEERIALGTEHNKQFEGADERMEKVQKQMMAIGELKIMQSKIKDADDRVVLFNEKQEEQVTLNAKIDELKNLRKNFIEAFTPKIDGIKLVVNDGIDAVDEANPDSDLEEGLYYNNRSMAELSESELWTFFMLICKELGVRFLFIENAQSLGSDAAETINWFVKEGFGNVFYTAMLRGQKELKVTINDEFI